MSRTARRSRHEPVEGLLVDAGRPPGSPHEERWYSESTARLVPGLAVLVIVNLKGATAGVVAVVCCPNGDRKVASGSG
jgi:hypothetical protein